MKSLEDMTTSEEVDAAYLAAIRNMSFADIDKLKDDDEVKKSDSPVLAHAKACLRKYRYLTEGIELQLPVPKS